MLYLLDLQRVQTVANNKLLKCLNILFISKAVVNLATRALVIYSDINKSCVLIITGPRIFQEKAVAQLLLPGRGSLSSEVSPFTRLPYEMQSDCVLILYQNLLESLTQHGFSSYYSTCIKNSLRIVYVQFKYTDQHNKRTT